MKHTYAMDADYVNWYKVVVEIRRQTRFFNLIQRIIQQKMYTATIQIIMF